MIIKEEPSSSEEEVVEEEEGEYSESEEEEVDESYYNLLKIKQEPEEFVSNECKSTVEEEVDLSKVKQEDATVKKNVKLEEQCIRRILKRIREDGSKLDKDIDCKVTLSASFSYSDNDRWVIKLFVEF